MARILIISTHGSEDPTRAGLAFVMAKGAVEAGHRPEYTAVPTVAFTVPPLASVGLQEATARRRNLKFKTNQGDTSGWYSSRRVGMNHSGYKVLIEEDSDRILGAHLLGPHAEEVINLFTMAIRFGLRAGDLKKMRYTYPSHSDDISYMV